MKRVLIANRGEIACRITRSCHALGLEAIAVYSEADAGAKHVAEADQAHAIGGAAAKDSYLVIDNILEAAAASNADAIHPGYGFLAENAAFADAVEQAGMIWIGPSAKTITDMGDKQSARTLAVNAGVPVVPGSRQFPPGELGGLDDAARAIGYPLFVKATKGGGGIGMKRVDEAAQLVEIAETTQAMAQKAFGDGTVYMETLISEPRHIEVQVFGLGNGQGVHFMERECSIQRRFQKIVEEAPASALDADLRRRMTGAALSLVRQERYRGAGTIEFILAPDGAFYFLEMNTRIQVEHPVTEMITGTDLVGLQLRLARGDDLGALAQGDDPVARGHAIECRVYAENPDKNFLPSPGRLSVFEPPEDGHGVRVDTGVREGDQITWHYDPMIAKLIVHGGDRAAAIEKMLTALDQFRIEGIVTNIAFLKRVVSHTAFRAGAIHTGFVNQHLQDLLGA